MEKFFEGGRKQNEGIPMWMIWVLVGVVLIGYGQILSFPNLTVYDDAMIAKNPVIVGKKAWMDAWTTDFWGLSMDAAESHRSWRPALVLVFRGIYSIFGESSLPFRVVSLTLYGGMVVGMAVLGWKLGLSVGAAFLGALWFAVHPSHVETVGQVVGIGDLVSGVALVVVFLGDVWGGGSSWRVVGIWLVAAGAMLFKEQGLMITGLWGAAEVLVVLPRKGNFVWGRFGLAALAGIVMLWLRFMVMPRPPHFPSHMNPGAVIPNATSRRLTVLYYYARHCLMLLGFPGQQAHDWSGSAIAPVVSFRDDRVLWSIFVVGVVGVGLVALVVPWVMQVLVWRMEKVRAEVMVLALGVAVVVLTYLPASNLFFVVGYSIADRAVFLPSVGMGLLVMGGVDLGWKRGGKVLVGGVMVLLVLMLLKTLNYVPAFRSEGDLGRSALLNGGHMHTKNYFTLWSVREHAGFTVKQRLGNSERVEHARRAASALLANPQPQIPGQLPCNRSWYLPVAVYGHRPLASKCMEWIGHDVYEAWKLDIQQADERDLDPTWPPRPNYTQVAQASGPLPTAFPSSWDETDNLDYAICTGALDPCHQQGMIILAQGLWTIGYHQKEDSQRLIDYHLSRDLYERGNNVVESMRADGSLERDLGQWEVGAVTKINLANAVLKTAQLENNLTTTIQNRVESLLIDAVHFINNTQQPESIATIAKGVTGLSLFDSLRAPFQPTSEAFLLISARTRQDWIRCLEHGNLLMSMLPHHAFVYEQVSTCLIHLQRWSDVYYVASEGLLRSDVTMPEGHLRASHHQAIQKASPIQTESIQTLYNHVLDSAERINHEKLQVWKTEYAAFQSRLSPWLQQLP